MRIFHYLFLAAALILSVVSCSLEGVLQQILGEEAEVPVFLDCRAVSPTEVVFSFSHPVRVVSLEFDPAQETESIDEGNEVKVTLTGGLREGMKITADILVEDAKENTLNVIVPFRARNDRMPALVFNELRSEYSKPKVEFIEFLTLGAGNLGAMRLFIASSSLSNPVYEFPPVEVTEGEYIVLHLRTVEEGCLDETGQDLSLSGGTETHDGSRDFWLPEAVKMLRKTDALWIIDQDDRIIDAVLLSESKGSEWSSNAIAQAAALLGGKKAWLPASIDNEGDNWVPEPSDAFITLGTTNTRTMCRDESIPSQPRAGNWYITATSSATPGKPNNTKRYN